MVALKRKHPFSILFIILMSWTMVPAVAGTSGGKKSAPPRYENFRPLAPPLNSARNEFSPSLTADGKTMIFNSRRSGERYQNIYISTFAQGRWSKPRPLTPVNSRFNDETPFISADGRLIIFSSDRDGSMEMPKDARGRIRVSYDLYWSVKKNGQWKRPMKLPGNINTMHHERSPSLNLKNGELYFVTWPFGDMNKSRIMRSVYRKGKFGRPEVLPDPINVGFMELAPVIAPEKGGLYFSSKRPGGYGGWDLYFVKAKDGVYGKPVNLGPSINSAGNDLFFSRVGKQVFFCSNRPGGKGRYDIYSAGEPAKDMRLQFLVRDAKTKQPLSLRVKLSASVQRAPGKIQRAAVVKRSNDKGEFTLIYRPEVKQVKIHVNKKGYLPYQKTASLRKDGKVQLVELTPVKKDGSFDVHAINFDYNSARIKQESFKYLDSLVRYLRENSSLRFSITGHTDLHGTPTYNRRLSLRRAKAVRDYLVSKGLQSSRFRVRGAGMTRPLVNAKGGKYDRMNRRTEFRPLKEDDAGKDSSTFSNP